MVNKNKKEGKAAAVAAHNKAVADEKARKDKERSEAHAKRLKYDTSDERRKRQAKAAQRTPDHESGEALKDRKRKAGQE